MPPDSRPRQLNGGEAIAAWLEDNPVERWPVLEKALFAIADGSWVTSYFHRDDVTSPHAVIMVIDDDGLIIRWREFQDYPGYFRCTYIGPLDETDQT